MKMIDFCNILPKNQIVLSGKDKGIQTRQHFSLDSLDSQDESIRVVFPETLQAMTPSFITGMFSPSVKACGSVERFFEKYIFEVNPPLKKQIFDGAQLSLASGSAFTKNI